MPNPIQIALGQIEQRQQAAGWACAAGDDSRASAKAKDPPITAEQARFGKHQRDDLPSVKPMALSTPNSPVRSRTACAMVLPVTSRMVKNTAPKIAATMKAMLPIWLAQPWMNAPSGSVFVSGGGILKFRVHQLGHFRRLRGVFDADGVPADLPFAPVLPRFVEIIVAEKQRRRVGAFVLAVKDADDVELPGAAAVGLRPDGGLNWYLVADFPVETARPFAGPTIGAGARLQPGVLLLRRQDEFRDASRRNSSGSTGFCMKKFFGS